MERAFHERNKSLGRGEKSNECKHRSKQFSCSKRILRKLAQWVMMSSFSPLDYWKNFPLWEVCVCLCWVRTWHSGFSTHFCYKKVPLCLLQSPKNPGPNTFYVSCFLHRRCGHCSVTFRLEGGVFGPRVGPFSYLQHFSLVHPFICCPTAFYLVYK